MTERIAKNFLSEGKLCRRTKLPQIRTSIYVIVIEFVKEVKLQLNDHENHFGKPFFNIGASWITFLN